MHISVIVSLHRFSCAKMALELELPCYDLLEDLQSITDSRHALLGGRLIASTRPHILAQQ